jgi:hypothetical protein
MVAAAEPSGLRGVSSLSAALSGGSASGADGASCADGLEAVVFCLDPRSAYGGSAEGAGGGGGGGGSGGGGRGGSGGSGTLKGISRAFPFAFAFRGFRVGG